MLPESLSLFGWGQAALDMDDAPPLIDTHTHTQLEGGGGGHLGALPPHWHTQPGLAPNGDLPAGELGNLIQWEARAAEGAPEQETLSVRRAPGSAIAAGRPRNLATATPAPRARIAVEATLAPAGQTR